MGRLNMADFSEIRSDNNEVIRVVKISDEDVAANGGNLSVEAETWVANNIPNDSFLMEQRGWSEYPDTYWKQTAKDNSFRKCFGRKGSTYDSSHDGFIPKNEFPDEGLSFNTTKWIWE
tara:strand:+ start:270 stop:623 length:354 start_codon:yes stop_codon:yes gene_type:complete